ncbi:uncharacterized protein ACO6RY_10713 [Pungitius sinensis]
MPSVLPTGGTLAVPAHGQRPFRIPRSAGTLRGAILGRRCRAVTPKMAGWHTRTGRDLRASLHSEGTCLGTRRTQPNIVITKSKRGERSCVAKDRK